MVIVIFRALEVAAPPRDNARLDRVQQISDRSRDPSRWRTHLTWVLMFVGAVGLVIAIAVNASDARLAADQDWSPFVLVTGLLLVGLVANDDGLFAAAGNQLARASTNGVVLFVGATVMIGSVTAVLNLDTSVAFLTPVLIYTARSRGGGEAPLLYGCLLLSNAGSLFLPGSNLTNLIVLGHFHMSGAAFFSDMWAPALAALIVTGAVIFVMEHRELQVGTQVLTEVEKPTLGLGLVAVIAATILVLVLPSPALAVVIVGLVAIGWRLVARKDNFPPVFEVVGVPVLVGLFGLAVG